LDGKKRAKFGICGKFFLTKFAPFYKRKMAFLAAKSFGAYWCSYTMQYF